MAGDVTYWDGEFPDPAGGELSYWGGHYPEGAFDPSVAPGVGPSGSATFALDLRDGFKVTFAWETDVIKTYDGTEFRASLTSLPKSRYAGAALLVGPSSLIDRGVLARHAAQGLPFLIGLPHESVPVTGSAGATVSVDTTTLLDWLVVGQRVVVKSGDGLTAVDAVIQSWTGDTFVLSVAPGIGIGGLIMPAVAVYLDPQQGFQRYRSARSIENWQLAARAIPFGFEQLERKAFAALAGATAGAFHDATAISAYAGAAGNGVTLTLAFGGLGAGTVSVVGTAVTFSYQAGVTTIGGAITALAPYISFSGTLPALGTALLLGDAFGPVALAGGLDRIFGNMGVGAAVATFDGRPVWDRPLLNEDTLPDSLHSMVDLVDLGGVPAQFGPAKQPDWGRTVAVERLDRAEWQWLKAFLYTVRGRQKSWLLPTWRADLAPVSLAPGELVVQGPSAASGDVFAWYPSLCRRVQVMLGDGTIGYCVITGATDNGDGTVTLAITTSLAGYNPGDGGAELTNLRLVSWLDVCRFETDDFEVTWKNGLVHAFSSQARVIQDPVATVGVGVFDAELGAESSQPREFVEITHGATTYRIATGDRDITYMGNVFTATTSTRTDINIAQATGEQQLTVSVPATHALARRYLTNGGVPPRQVLVTLRRIQLATGAVEQRWNGYVTEVSTEGHMAKFTAPDRMQRSLQRRLPTVVNDAKCNAVLFDGMCKADPTTFTIATAPSFVDGATVHVGTVGGNPDQWARGGRLVHVASGESQLITDQVGVALKLQAPIPELKAGDAVKVLAGCDHTVATCRNKFSNIVNYVGLPNRPTKNPFIPTGTGAGETG